ncbi:MAG: MBL fold metallo-hydrolase [Halobacteriales archaeon]
MVHSNWGDWFVREEVEAADPDGLSLWYLGCNGFVARSPETTLYIDPYFGTGEPPATVRMLPVPMDPADATRCDAVLATHEHIDHMHAPSYRPLVEDLGADLYATEPCYTDPDHETDYEPPEERKHVIEPGDTYGIGDLTVHVRAGNDPDAIGEVSYVIEHASGTYFNSGDSRPAPLFADIGEEFDIDVGSLTFGTTGRIHEGDSTEVTTWYSDENQVIELANALELDRLVPVHWDMWKGVSADPTVLHRHAASFEYPRILEVAEIGDRLDVGSPGIRPPRSL